MDTKNRHWTCKHPLRSLSVRSLQSYHILLLILYDVYQRASIASPKQFSESNRRSLYNKIVNFYADVYIM